MNSLLLSRCLTVVLFLCCIFFWSGNLKAEFVFLKTGEILEGTVIVDTPVSITFRGKDQKTITIKKTNVLRIQFAKIYTGKVFVQKIDGTNITGYVVEENNDEYILRSALDNPEEFVIKRDQILFMTRGNPSRLQNDGDIGKDRISLKWDKPYNPVSRYFIYLKGPSDSSFTKVGEQKNAKASLNNLKSSTQYTVKVTAVDESGEESLPTNEFAFSTKDIHYRSSREIAIEVRPYFIKPTGTFGNIFNRGYGVCAASYFDDIFFDGFDFGLSAGYWRFTPKLSGAKTSYMVPAFMNVRFRIPVTDFFLIVPTLESGVSYNHFTYNALQVKSSKGAFEPITNAELELHYKIADTSIIAGAGYFNIFEKKERMSAIIGYIGLSIRL